MPKVKTQLVKVILSDIRDGKRGAPFACPIALALRRTFHQRWYVWLTSAWHGKQLVMLPPRAKQFIKRFDSNKQVKPLTFKLRCPK